MAQNETKKVVPFGKYKGEPVEKLLADPQYKDWLASQSWFPQKFPDIYQVIINYGQEPEETPEHNALQARFLDEAFCAAVARAVLPADKLDIEGLIADEQLDDFDWEEWEEQENRRDFIKNLRFEFKGWDVFFTYSHFSLYRPRQVASCADCQEWKQKQISFRQDMLERQADTDARSARLQKEIARLEGKTDLCQRDCFRGCPNRRTPRRFGVSDHMIMIEGKPTIGDDFPAVIRQLNGRWGAGEDPRTDRILLVEHLCPTSVPAEAVIQMIEKSAPVRVLRLADLKV